MQCAQKRSRRFATAAACNEVNFQQHSQLGAVPRTTQEGDRTKCQSRKGRGFGDDAGEDSFADSAERRCVKLKPVGSLATGTTNGDHMDPAISCAGTATEA